MQIRAACTSAESIWGSAQITQMEGTPNPCAPQSDAKEMFLLRNHEWQKKRKRKICEEEKIKEKEGGGITELQVCGNLRQPQWAIKQMGNLVMLLPAIKSGGREGKNREMKQNVILMHEIFGHHHPQHQLFKSSSLSSLSSSP